MVRVVRERCETLLAHPADSLRARSLAGFSWSALELAALASVDLDAATGSLARLLGTEGHHPTPARINAPTAAANMLAPSVLLGAVIDHAVDLVAVIDAASVTASEGIDLSDSGAAGVIWFVLSDAIDRLDEAEMASQAAIRASDNRPRRPTGAPVPTKSVGPDPPRNPGGGND